MTLKEDGNGVSPISGAQERLRPSRGAGSSFFDDSAARTSIRERCAVSGHRVGRVLSDSGAPGSDFPPVHHSVTMDRVYQSLEFGCNPGG